MDATILIVDNDIKEVESLKTTLENMGFRVVQMSNGATGLKFLQSVKPKAIISEFAFPTMAGTSFAQQVKENPHLKDVPIFIYTTRKALDGNHADMFDGIFFKPDHQPLLDRLRNGILPN